MGIEFLDMDVRRDGHDETSSRFSKLREALVETLLTCVAFTDRLSEGTC
jgi:hypothetical protein